MDKFLISDVFCDETVTRERQLFEGYSDLSVKGAPLIRRRCLFEPYLFDKESCENSEWLLDDNYFCKKNSIIVVLYGHKYTSADWKKLS